MISNFEGKVVMVTGACGTVGAELVRQLSALAVAQIVCIDNNESELFFLMERYREAGKVSAFLADIRDLDALTLRMRGVDVVLHSAALKHVGLCEDSPNQAIQTNILGTQNVISAAVANGVERVVFTSSDKAVNPTNVMGTSKLMGERLMTAASEIYGASAGNSIKGTSPTIFSSTRFGNVLGSRGSVLPLFRQQIDSGGPLTLTDREMTRFIMTLEEAAKLVLESVWLAVGGEVMVTKMPVARIEDLAELLVAEAAQGGSVEIRVIGAKPGEKLYEELMNDEEVRRTWDLGDFFVVLSAFANPLDEVYAHLRGAGQPNRPYKSDEERALTVDELAGYLRARGLI